MKRRLNRVSACKALLCLMAFGIASPTVSAAPVISATKKDAISTDVNGDTNANPGDTLKYTVTITNSGDASGTTVQFTDTLDANTTLVAGSVTATPIAVGDNYSISGNTNLDSTNMFITAANGLLANDSDPDGGPVSATPQSSAATTQGGTVDVFADGSFEYIPVAGNSTTDTFTYTITDDEGKTDTGTASIMFPEVIWYVDSSRPNGNGTSGSPFDNVASAASASGPGHMIFVLTGSGVTGPTTGITLDSNESLVGQGVDLVVTFNGTPETLYAAGTAPVIGTPVTLATNNTIKGLNIGNSTNPVAGTGIGGSSYGTLTVSDASVTTSAGPALNLATGTLNNASFASLSSTTSSGRGLSITGSAGTLSVTGATAITGPTTEGLFLGTNTGTFNFLGGLNITNSGNTGFSASSGGTVNVTGNGNFIDTTTGTALNLSNTTTSLRFQRISASNAPNGIVLNNTGSGGLTVTGTGTAGSGGTIQNTTLDGILLTNAQSVSLSFMNVTNAGENGIFGTTVTGLNLIGCSITNNGDDSGDSGIRVNNLLGSALWLNLTVTGSELANVFIDNTSGLLSFWTIAGGNFSNLGTAFGGNSILANIHGTATLFAGSISTSTISNNRPARGITIQAQDTATISGFTVQTSTFTNNGLQASFEQSGSANLSFKLLDNPTMTMTLPATGTSHAVNVFSSSTSTGGTIQGRIQGNTIGNAAVPSSGSPIGNGIRVNIQGRTVGTFLIDGNVIRQTPQARGIDAQFLGPLTAGQPLTQSDITLTSNDVNPQDSTGFPLAAIYAAADSQGTSPVRVRSDIRLNTVPVGAASDVLPTFIIFDEVVAAAEAQLVDTAPVNVTCTDQLTTTNTGSASANPGCALIAGPINTPP